MQSNEAFELRLLYASEKYGQKIDNYVVVFDLLDISYSLDFGSIAYIKKVSMIDQANYPERLHKLFIINAPWFFSAILTIFKPFLDKRTLDKIVLLGSDYISTLEQYIDRGIIRLRTYNYYFTN